MEDTACCLSKRLFRGVLRELQVGFEIAKARVALEVQPHCDLAATFALLLLHKKCDQFDVISSHTSTKKSNPSINSETRDETNEYGAESVCNYKTC